VCGDKCSAFAMDWVLAPFHRGLGGGREVGDTVCRVDDEHGLRLRRAASGFIRLGYSEEAASECCADDLGNAGDLVNVAGVEWRLPVRPVEGDPTPDHTAAGKRHPQFIGEPEPGQHELAVASTPLRVPIGVQPQCAHRGVPAGDGVEGVQVGRSVFDSGELFIPNSEGSGL
jgi:hypothetical protein